MVLLARGGNRVRIGVAESLWPGHEWTVDKGRSRGEGVGVQWVLDRFLALSAIDSDLWLRDGVREHRSRSWISGPIPVRHAQRRRSSLHGGSGRVWVRAGDLLRNSDKLLLEESDVRPVPCGKQNGVVCAVAVSVAAAVAWLDAIPVLARHTVDTSDLVVAGLIVLRSSLPLLHSLDKERPLLRLSCLELADLETRLR